MVRPLSVVFGHAEFLVDLVLPGENQKMRTTNTISEPCAAM